MADDFPGRAAEAVRRLLEHGWHGLEHVARDRSDERQHHDAEDQAGGQYADAIWWACEQARQAGHILERADQRRLHVLLQPRCEHEQTPDRSEEHTSELQSLMRNSYSVFCLQKKK